jgi:peptide chain release factor subunit 1
MQANDITRERLRRLAGTRPHEGKVLSLFLNLDPREFATAPARSTEIRSMLDRASRQVRDDESLTHAEKVGLRDDLERLQSELGNASLDLKGAHGVAVFASSPADLFEILKLSEPVEHDPVIADTPFIAPLTAIGSPERWCVVLVNRRTARVFCGPGDQLEEIELIEDDVHGQHDKGGWSQANYQRSVDKDAFDHLKRSAEVAFAHLKNALPAGILVGAPQELTKDFEDLLHPYLRERLAGRLDIDVEHSSPDDVRRAARPHIEDATRAKQDAALARLAEEFGAGTGRAASGLEDVRLALEEQRVEILLVDAGFEAEGAIEKALEQSADVQVLRDRPELASHGHIAAVLRF